MKILDNELQIRPFHIKIKLLDNELQIRTFHIKIKLLKT